MKRLALLSLPFLFISPAFAADLDRPRYTEREVIIERSPRVVIEEHHHYRPAPVIEYYEDEPVTYVERPYYGLRHLHLYGWYPRRHHWVRRHHHHHHWAWRHHHRHHRHHW